MARSFAGDIDELVVEEAAGWVTTFVWRAVEHDPAAAHAAAT